MNSLHRTAGPALLVLNQMAGPMTRELVEDLADEYGCVALLTGHPDTLARLRHPGVTVTRSARYCRGSLAVRAISWGRYVLHALYWVIQQRRDVPLLVFSNPPVLVWFAAAMQWLRGTRFVVIVHDIYPDVAIRQGVLSENSLLARCWRWLNRAAYQRADAVMTLGRFMAANLTCQFDVSKTRSKEVVVVSPWADCRYLAPIAKTNNPFAIRHHLVHKCTVAYSGNMGWGHDLESVLEAARALRPLQDRLHFVLIGEGPKWSWLHDELDRHPEPHVTLLPWLDEADLPSALACADLAIVSMEAELSRLAVPSKAISFLAAGVPLMAICEDETELADLVHDFQCGTVVPPRHPHILRTTIAEALNAPMKVSVWREAARAAALHFDRQHQVEAIVGVLNQYLMPVEKRPTRQYQL